MKASAIIAEYNPLHNGHQYQINKVKKASGDQPLIIIMSGNFVQRGEPAILDKWTRAEMAIHAGADLVIELPFYFASGSASYFAEGAVSLLEKIGLVENLYFGAEHSEINDFRKIVSILSDEPSEWQELLHKYLDQGYSFPEARSLSLVEYIKSYDNDTSSDLLSSLMSKPNNILCIEYLLALEKIKSKIKPFIIQRTERNYQDNSKIKISSATYLRQLINDGENNLSSIEQFMPQNAAYQLIKAYHRSFRLITKDDFSQLLLFKLRNYNLIELEKIADMKEGLHNRLRKNAAKTGSWSQLLYECKTSRYTATRIQRIFLYVLLDITTQEQKQIITQGPAYIRILGFSDTGRSLINDIEEVTQLPILNKLSPTIIKKVFNEPDAISQILTDIKATDLYTCVYSDPEKRKAGQDFVRQPFYLSNDLNPDSF